MSEAPARAADPRREVQRRLARVQAGTGVVFATFLALHLVNTMLGALGPAVYDGVQRVLRLYYQLLPVEVVIVASGTVHFVVGIVRIALGRPAATNLRARAHRYAGYTLVLFFFGHVIATRAPSFLGVGPSLGFAGLTYSEAYLPAFFFPYYVLLGIAGLHHLLQGLLVAAGVLGWRIPAVLTRPRVLRPVVGIGSVLIVVAVLAFAGALFPVHDPMDNDFARFASALVARYLGR